jgi:riboflavin kinase, archaea type
MLESGDLSYLKAIALMGGGRGPVFVSSQTIADTLHTSPQTASRRLKALESQGLISRIMSPDGQHIHLTKQGEEELHREYMDYCRIFSEGKTAYTLTGSVITGLGEGKYYMSLAGYRQQFGALLGFEPYPGTLNIRLSPSSLPIRKKIEAFNWIRIKGFSADSRTFGDARCLPCRIGNVPCAIIIPGRTHYPEDIIEVIAPVALRRQLGVEDSDTVTVEVGS